MSYNPPHKRHSKVAGAGSGGGNSSTTPIPESLTSHFNRSLNFKSKKRERAQKIIYADTAINKWFPVGLASSSDDSDDDRTRFLRFTSEGRKVFLENPWSFIAENVKQDLISAFQTVQNEMEGNKLQIVRPKLVARFGRIVFHRGPSAVQSSEDISLPEGTVRQLKRSFYTNASPSFMEYVINEGVQKMGLNFEEEKDIFHVKIADNTQPDSTISCKCTLPNDSKTLQLYKMELNQVRYMVADMSCLDRDLDLGLMLCAKRIMTDLSDDEMRCINDLIGSALLDPEVKGGLKWRLGKESAGDRFTVVGAWHTSAKSFRNSSIRLRVRHADRFDFRTSSGEVGREVIVKMPGIVSELQVQPTNDDLLLEMLQRNLKLIWDIFLCSGSLS